VKTRLQYAAHKADRNVGHSEDASVNSALNKIRQQNKTWT